MSPWAGVACAVVFALALCDPAVAHDTPCNVNNDTYCLEGVREEFIRTDYWFGDGYRVRCPYGPANMDFNCMNPDLNHTSIASRLLQVDSFDTNIIEQFLRIRYNTPQGSYMACGHQFNVKANSMDIDLDNTHTIYMDSWILGHRPTVIFDSEPGQLYTLVAYDAGYVRLGGIWVNIESGDLATGQEIYPYRGPVNPLYTLRNPFVFALFNQTAGPVVNIESLKNTVMMDIIDNNGHYYLHRFIDDVQLEGPVGVGYVVINTDPYSIQHFVDNMKYNNCPYLVSRQPDVIRALRVMGYNLTSNNSYKDSRGTFLTNLQLDLTVTYFSPEAHFDSCCQHNMMPMMEVTVDPVDMTPIMPLYIRNMPYIRLTQIDLGFKMISLGKLYTLFLLDVTDGVKNASSPNFVIHWQVVNIPGDSVERGDTVRPYLMPLPANRDEVRTFLFMLLEQSSRVDPTALWSYTGGNCDSRTVLRCRFDLRSLLKHLNFNLVGLNVFRSQQDSFTRAVQYGAVDPDRVATSMSQYKGMSKPDVQPSMTPAQACQNIPGYVDPCPTGCMSGHNHGDTVTTPPVTANVVTEPVHVHNHVHRKR